MPALSLNPPPPAVEAPPPFALAPRAPRPHPPAHLVAGGAVSLAVHAAVLLWGLSPWGRFPVDLASPPQGAAALELVASAEASDDAAEPPAEPLEIVVADTPPPPEPTAALTAPARSPPAPTVLVERGEPVDPPPATPLAAPTPVSGAARRADERPASVEVAASVAPRSATSQQAAAASSLAAEGMETPTPPAIVANPPAEYPAAALAARQMGRVWVRADIDAAGAVHSARVLTSSGHPLLDEAAVAAVRRWRFSPRAGAAAADLRSVRVPIDFVIRER